ncbi:hypothetical protein D9M72_117430 [compost metagenome]
MEASSRVQLGKVPVSTKVLPARVVPCGAASATGFTPCAFSCPITSRLCCSAKKWRIDAATTGPTSGTADSASSSASMMASMLPKWRATSRAVVSPTWRMPSANSSLASPGVRAFSMAATRLSADFWPMRSSPTSSSGRSPYRSASVLTRPLSTSWSTSFSPRPSISSALRLAACQSVCLRWAPQNRPPVQRAMVSSSRRSMAEPQTGQAVGMTNSRASSGRFSSTGASTSGITSPARRTMTVSPMRTSLRRISSSLCSVAFVTVTPPTNTGFRRATGVMAPVRPTWTSMSSSVVVASSAANLCASAKRGARATKPSTFWAGSESTL